MPLRQQTSRLSTQPHRSTIANKVTTLQQLHQFVIAVTLDATGGADTSSFVAICRFAGQTGVDGLSEGAFVVCAVVDVEAKDCCDAETS